MMCEVESLDNQMFYIDLSDQNCNYKKEVACILGIRLAKIEGAMANCFIETLQSFLLLCMPKYLLKIVENPNIQIPDHS